MDQGLRRGDCTQADLADEELHVIYSWCGLPMNLVKKCSISQKIVLNCLLQLSHNQSLWQIWGSRQHILWIGTMVFSQCSETKECKHTTHSQMLSHCVHLESSPPDKEFSTDISRVISKSILISQRTWSKRICLGGFASYSWLVCGQL